MAATKHPLDDAIEQIDESVRSTASAKTFEIKKLEAIIDHLSIPIVPGRVTVLVGANGSGKSRAIAAVKKAVSGEGRLSTSDGKIGGTVEGFGVTVKVSRGGVNRRTGADELEIENLEDRLSIGDLVDPGLKDPVAADAHRIKTLVSLSGISTEPSLFYEMMGGKSEFESIVSENTLEKKDLVEFCASFKKDLERVSREHAARASVASKALDAIKQANEGIDLTAESNEDVLQADLELAVEDASALRERRENAVKVSQTAVESRKSLEEAQTAYSGPTVKTAELEVDEDDSQFAEAHEKLLEARAEVTKLQLAVELKRSHVQAAKDRLHAARDHENSMVAWKKSIDAAQAVESPTNTKVEFSEQNVKVSREAVEDGARVRDAIAREAKAMDYQLVLDADMKTADSLRDAAKGTEDVLSKIVANMGGPFRVDNEFRLVVKHHKRGECYFCELSLGEGFKLCADALLAASEKQGVPALMCIEQHFWEGLDGRNQLDICRQVAGTPIAVLTAESTKTDDPKDEVEAVTL